MLLFIVITLDLLFQRVLNVSIRSYRYTAEWMKVRDDNPDARVRGVIAQELAEVFPEYVTVIPEYTLAERNFTIKDFHQVPILLFFHCVFLSSFLLISFCFDFALPFFMG